MTILQLAWERFSIIARVFGDMQARVVATILYFTMVLPFGIIMQLGNNPFKRTTDNMTAKWEMREPVDNTLEGAARQG
jgi:hypothetical protein